MDYDVLESVSQGSDGAQDAENSRIAAIADELRRRSKLYEAQHGDGQPHVSPFEIEQRITESFAKEHGLWIPIDAVFDLGTPGPSGNENDTYSEARSRKECRTCATDIHRHVYGSPWLQP